MTDLPGSGEPLVFPMGHYLGASFPRGATEPDFHLLRIGWNIYKLDNDEELGVWALAHGMPAPGGAQTGPWTRRSMEAMARSMGIRNFESRTDDLLARDLIVEVAPGSEEAIDFAFSCRTRSLLVGDGNTVDDPLHYGITASEDVPPIKVDAFTFEVWKWGHGCDSVWHTCHILAAAGDPEEPDQVDPERVLDRCLAAIQMLLANGAVYLDEARDDAVVDEGTAARQPVGER
jgi:hypothetical protein